MKIAFGTAATMSTQARAFVHSGLPGLIDIALDGGGRMHAPELT